MSVMVHVDHHTHGIVKIADSHLCGTTRATRGHWVLRTQASRCEGRRAESISAQAAS